MGWLGILTISLSVSFIVSCGADEPPPKKTVFEPLLQSERRAQEVQKAVDANADATRKAVDTQERGDTAP